MVLLLWKSRSPPSLKPSSFDEGFFLPIKQEKLIRSISSLCFVLINYTTFKYNNVDYIRYANRKAITTALILEILN